MFKKKNKDILPVPSYLFESLLTVPLEFFGGLVIAVPKVPMRRRPKINKKDPSQVMM